MIQRRARRSARYAALASIAAMTFVPASTQAAVVITILQQGSDVVATGSGALNVSALQSCFCAAGSSGLTEVVGNTATAVIGSISSNPYSASFLTGASGPANFGSGTYKGASSGSGDIFGVGNTNNIGDIFIPAGYSSGQALSGSSTWTGATFASLGLTPGVYDFTWGSAATADSLQVRIGSPLVAGVPEPSTWAMMMLGVFALGATLRRRNRSAAAPA